MQGKCVAVLPVSSLHSAAALLWRQADILQPLQLQAVTAVTRPQHAPWQRSPSHFHSRRSNSDKAFVHGEEGRIQHYCSCPSSGEHAKHMCCDSHPRQELGSCAEAVGAHCFSSGVLQFSPGAWAKTGCNTDAVEIPADSQWSEKLMPNSDRSRQDTAVGPLQRTPQRNFQTKELECYPCQPQKSNSPSGDTSDTAASYLTHRCAAVQAPTNLSHYGSRFYNVTT